jgi:hypothetical protein
MTVEKLEEWILDGRGVGLLDAYQPWIQITKRNTSSRSAQTPVHMPGLTRLCHYLSLAERKLAQLLRWIGVTDLREQYPLWPWPHPQPLDEITGVPARSLHPGMRAIAKESGIKLSKYPGLNIHKVLTLDLLGTLPDSWSVPLIGFSCKPESMYLEANPSDRLPARLELDRRYCVAAGIPHRMVHPEQIPKLLSTQLDWLQPVDPTIDYARFAASREYCVFVERLSKRVHCMPAITAAEECAKGFRWNDATIAYALHTAIWRLDVDGNPAKPILMTEPLPRGGIQVRDHFRKKLL